MSKMLVASMQPLSSPDGQEAGIGHASQRGGGLKTISGQHQSADC